MITNEQKEAEEAVEQIKMMITEEAEKIMQKFNTITGNTNLRDALATFCILQMRKLMNPKDENVEKGLIAAEGFIIQGLQQKQSQLTNIIIPGNKK